MSRSNFTSPGVTSKGEARPEREANSPDMRDVGQTIYIIMPISWIQSIGVFAMATDNKTNGGGYDVRKYIAELIGTMALVFFGCGAAVLAGRYIGFLGIAFAFGMVLLVLVYSIGPISGCHVNPAVTVAMLAARKISVKDGILYIVVQCIGAIIGAELLFWIALGLPGYKVGINGLGQNGFDAFSPGLFTLQAGLVAETVLTFFFLLAIFGATSKETPKGFAGIGIGFSLFIVHLVGIPVTGTSVNPARSLGPALVLAANGSGDALNQLWLFWLAPMVGAILAAAVWVLMLAPDEPKPVVEPRKIKVREMPQKKVNAKKKSVDADKDLDEDHDEDLEAEEEAGEAEDGGEDRRAAMEHDDAVDRRTARESSDKEERRAADEAEDAEDEAEDEEDEKDQDDEENVVKYEENEPKGKSR
jgi:aquaporin Z